METASPLTGSAVERGLVRLGVRDHVARLLASTPSLRASWLSAGGVVILFSTWAARSGPRGLMAFLVIAPLVPLAGVAAAYGPWMDPMHEITRPTPTSGLRILLLRTAAVLVSTGVIVGAASLAIPASDRTAAAWILPSLALTFTCLALSTFVPVPWAAVGITALWLTAVAVAANYAGDPFAIFHGPGQVAFFVVIVGSAIVLARRRERLEVEGRARQQRVIDAAEAERRRIERNIHDGAQQQLVAIAVKLGVAKTLVDRSPARAVELLDALQAEAQEALEALRDLTHVTCPPILSDQGLTAALELRAKKSPIPVTVDADGLDRFPLDVETTAYFCCLEALQNATKYARASHATISLRRVGGELSFSVSDDGAGFDPETARHGVGLRSMRERTSSLGGSLEIRSTPGSGTLVIGRIPVFS
jgi:signal transduction histidine kinase